MEMDRTVAVGVGGVLAGFLLSYAIGASGRAGLETRLREQGELLTSVSALETRLGALDGKLDENAAALDGKLDQSVAALTEHVTAATSGPDDGLQALTDRVGSLGDDLAARLEAVGPSVRTALTGDFEDVRGGLAALATRSEAAAGEALDAVAGREGGGEAPVGPVGDPALATGEGQEIAVAGTAVLGEGAVRVFLSSTDAEAGRAQVAVNGFRREAIALGGSLPAGDCTLVMTGLAEGGATFDATCGETAAAEAEEAATSAPADAAVVSAFAGGDEELATPSQTLSVGQTAIFADGSVRVFLSSVDSEAGSARVAVNAAKPAAIAVGEPQTIGDCSVILTSVAPGSATFGGTCGADAAAADDAPAGSGVGSEVSVGSAVTLGGGELRVFLSAFDEAAGTARVAINGFRVTSLTMSEPVEAGACRVELTGGAGRTAVIDGSC